MTRSASRPNAADDLRDPVALCQALLRCDSVTPRSAGALELCAHWGEALGFSALWLPFGAVVNLSLLRPGQGPHFGFAGHVDVVPAGETSGWTHPPFGGVIADDCVWGRGAVDMKGAIACFFAAMAALLADGAELPTLSLLLTSDEEGPGVEGTVLALPEIEKRGRLADHYLVGEPTSEAFVGDVVKNGRRGSLNADITVIGREGHVAYPHLALNPLPIALDLLAALRARRLDDGAPGFDPSNLEITAITMAPGPHNVIAGRVEARFNIRFNSAHRGADLVAWVESLCRASEERSGARIEARLRVTGEAFYTRPSGFTDLVAGAAGARLSTAGGTSDARFIAHYRPVAELGLRNGLAHKTDERVPIADLKALTKLYGAILAAYGAMSS